MHWICPARLIKIHRIVRVDIQAHLLHSIRPRQGIRPVKDLRHLLEASVLGLGEEEVDQGQVDADHHAPDDVVLPLDRLHCHRIGEAVVYAGEIARQLIQHGRLRAQRVRHHLHDVGGGDRRAGVVEGHVEEDHGKDGTGVAVVLEVLLLVDGGADRPDDVGEQHPAHSEEEQGPTAGFVN